MATGTFRTEPFTCPSCVKKIEGAVQRIPGVSKVHVGFATSKVTVTFDDAAVAPDAITARIST